MRYCREGRVQSLLVEGKKVRATVVGSRNYRVLLDPETEKHKCTCPYAENCKHMAATLRAYRKDKSVVRTETIEEELSRKPKKELIGTVLKLLRAEPRLAAPIIQEPLKDTIRKLQVNHDEDTFVEEANHLLERILEQDEKIGDLMLLFRKCIETYEEYAGISPLEDSLFSILRAISDEAKQVPLKKREATLQEIVDKTREFDFFWDALDDEGVAITYHSWYLKD